MTRVPLPPLDSKLPWRSPGIGIRILQTAVLVASAWTAGTGCSDPQLAEPQRTEAQAAAPGETAAFNIRDVFPPGPGRELVFDNCQSCHVLVPIFVLPMDEAAWYRNSLEHRERVEGLDDEDFETLYTYLSSTFTPDRPAPVLPPALRDTWTTY